MALLAEELVEEWLNRNGYLTVRGIKLGVQEIDLLAVKRCIDGEVECRHIEVQASMRPVSYISRVPAALQKTGRAANSAKRSPDELIEGVSEWVHKKFDHPKKIAVRQQLWPGNWTKELVVNNVKSEDEVELIRGCGVTIWRLAEVVDDLRTEGPFSAASADFVDLIQMGRMSG